MANILYKGKTEYVFYLNGAQVPPPMEPVPWSPAYISTHLWLDASVTDSVVIESGQVSQWLDLSGNNRHAYQNIVSSRPVLGVDEIVFTNDYFDCPISITNNFQIFGLVKFNTTQSPLIGNLVVASSTSNWMVGRRTTADMRFGVYNDDGFTTFASANFSGYNLWSFKKAASRITTLNANTSVTINDTTFTAMTVPTIGAYPFGTKGNMNLKELIIVDTSLYINDDEQKLEGYLMHKGGLSSFLPVGHPYKDNPPMIYVP